MTLMQYTLSNLMTKIANHTRFEAS